MKVGWPYYINYLEINLSYIGKNNCWAIMYKSLALLTLFCLIGLGATDSSASNEISTSVKEKWNATQSDNSTEDDKTLGRRIIGGQRAVQNQHSYVVQLYIDFMRELHFCSGTVISNIHILTAAHCVYSEGEEANFVTAEIPFAYNFIRRVTFNSHEVHAHPYYHEHLHYDIAILKSDHPFMYYGKVPSLPLPETVSDIFTYTAAVVVGWGQTSDGGPLSPTLQYAYVNTIPNELCKLFYGPIIIPDILCTLDFGKGLCGGDSGGPLLIVREGKMYVVGINSFGPTTCESYAPSGYTSVLSHLKWIWSVL